MFELLLTYHSYVQTRTVEIRMALEIEEQKAEVQTEKVVKVQKCKNVKAYKIKRAKP